MSSQKKFIKFHVWVPVFMCFFGTSVFAMNQDVENNSNVYRMPFVPENQQQVAKINELLIYRQSRIQDHKAYIKKLHTKLAKAKQQNISLARQVKQSSLALRILRSSIQVEADKLRLVSLKGRIQASQQNSSIEAAIVNGKPFLQTFSETKDLMNQKITALFSQLEPEITEDNAVRSFGEMRDQFFRSLAVNNIQGAQQ